MAPAASAAARPDCAPEITASGVDAESGSHFGFVYASRCDEVVRELRFRVTALDASGTEVADGTAFGGVLLAGTELAAAGTFHVPAGKKVVKADVEVLGYGAYPPADFDAWAKTEVVEIKQGKADSAGGYEVTGTVKADPSTAPVCISEFVLIMRDKTNKIVYADRAPISGARPPAPSFPVPAPAGIDFARTTIYAPQTPRTEHPSSGVACNGAG